MDSMKIFLVIAFYWITSLSLVFANKVLYSSGGPSIPAPLLITAFQCFFAGALGWVLGLGWAPKTGPFSFPRQTYSLELTYKLMPLTLVFVAMITFNNLCLKYVEVSFYQVARSLTIVFNVLFTYLMLGEPTSWKTVGTLLVVVTGFWVGADGEINFSLVGTVFGVLSSVFVALNGIYTSKLFHLVDKDKWRLAFYNNLNASFLLLAIAVVTSEPKVVAEHADVLANPLFWVMMVMAAALGLLINIATVMQITNTSPLTHNISGTAKACVQTAMGLYIYGNPTSAQAMVGLVLVLGGSLLYTYVRYVEDQAAREAKSKAKSEALPLGPGTPKKTTP